MATSIKTKKNISTRIRIYANQKLARKKVIQTIDSLGENINPHRKKRDILRINNNFTYEN